MAAFLRVGTLEGFAGHEADAMAYVAEALGGPAWRLVVTLTVLVSLAASLQATLVYLTRSFFAMGRDGVLPAALGALDSRSQPAAAIVLLTALGAVFTLATGLSASLRDALTFVLGGTSTFLGVLFLMSALAAVRLFARDRTAWLDGVVLPALAALALAVLLTISIEQADPGTRLFLLCTAALGLPLALWRGRVAGAGA
jgi:amino acid transporter